MRLKSQRRNKSILLVVCGPVMWCLRVNPAERPSSAAEISLQFSLIDLLHTDAVLLRLMQCMHTCVFPHKHRHNRRISGSNGNLEVGQRARSPLTDEFLRKIDRHSTLGL